MNIKWKDLQTGNYTPELLEALELLVKEVECYCADNVAAKGLCGICSAKAVLAKVKGE